MDAEASLVSGAGDTVTRFPASAADMFRCAGTQLGETDADAACAAGSTASAHSPSSTARVRHRDRR